MIHALGTPIRLKKMGTCYEILSFFRIECGGMYVSRQSDFRVPVVACAWKVPRSNSFLNNIVVMYSGY